MLAYVFLVMLPAKNEAMKLGLRADIAAEKAWQAGLVACIGCGLIEFVGSFFAGYLKKLAPRAALLSTLAGIALGFIAMSFLLRTYARPIIGLSTFGIILLTYFGGVRFRGGIPGGLVAVAVGTAIAWLTGIAPSKDVIVESPKWLPPIPIVGDLISGFQGNYFVTYLPIILPMGLFNLIGSLQNIESAEAAGDSYPVCPSLAVNGVGSVVAALFGSCFPTTIYIGHPGWKALGARAGYSVLNAVFFTAVCLSGVLGWITYAVPIDAGMAIVLYIGIVIAAQAFQATPREHAPAVAIGMLPGIAAWGTMVAVMSLQIAGRQGGPPLSENLVPSFQAMDIWIDGGFALREGFIFTSMILAATTVAIIQKKFRVAAAWCVLASLFSAVGLMHSYRHTGNDTAMNLFEPVKQIFEGTLDLRSHVWAWTYGYAFMALVMVLAPYVTEPEKGKMTKDV